MCKDSESADAKIETGLMSRVFAARAIRTAISPRLAISTFFVLAPYVLSLEFLDHVKVRAVEENCPEPSFLACLQEMVVFSNSKALFVNAIMLDSRSLSPVSILTVLLVGPAMAITEVPAPTP